MTDFLGRLQQRLGHDGGAAHRVAGGIVVDRRDDVDLDPPSRITTDDEALAEYLAEAEEDAQRLWPNVPRAEGAWRLLLSNVHEAVAVGATEISVNQGEVTWSGRRPLSPLPQDGGDYVWSDRPGSAD